MQEIRLETYFFYHVYMNKIFLQALWHIKSLNSSRYYFVQQVFAKLTFPAVDAMLK